MFYDNFEKLCAERGKSVYAVCNACGIKPSTSSSWKKNGNTPNGDVLALLAEQLNVTVDRLLGREEQDEVTAYLDELRNRSEMRMLFSVSKDATKEKIEQAVKIIEALRKNE